MSTGNTKSGCALIAVIGTICGGFSAALKSVPKAGSKGVKPPLVKPSPIQKVTPYLDNILTPFINNKDESHKNR
jgi:hypothetical protein